MILGMNSIKNLAIPFLSLIAALAIIGGAAYAYQKESAKTRQTDQLISSAQDRFRERTAMEQRQAVLAQARSSLQIASVRLSELRAAFSPVAAIDTAYASFAKAAAELATAAAKISDPVAPKIAAAERGLADTLQAWKILLASIPSTGPSPSQIAQAEHFAEQAQGYIDQIQTISDTLTPSNSGLTQGQIDAYQQTADTVSNNADETAHDLAVALPPVPPSDTGSTPPAGNSGSTSGSEPSNSGTASTDSPGQSANQTGSTSSNSPTAAEIAAQQQIVDQLQQQVDQLQQQDSSTSQDGGTTAPPGTLEIPPPPIQYDIYGRPKLIQGSNSDVYH
jgi:hypothetical protein